MHTKEGEVIKFLACKDGLYYHDVSTKNKSKASVNSYSQPKNNVDDIKSLMLVSTVNNNKVFYTKKQIKSADDAKDIQKELGWPSTQLFINMLSSNFFLNC